MMDKIRKLLDSGNRDDARIALTLIENKSWEEIRKYNIGKKYEDIRSAFTISHTKFPEYTIIGLDYPLADEIIANIYSEGIIIAKLKRH